MRDSQPTFCHDKSALAEEVESLLDLLLADSLVDAYIANTGKESDINFVARVLLVVVHELDEPRIVVAGNGKPSVVLADIRHRLAEFVLWEPLPDGTEVELRDESEGHGIAMEQRFGRRERETLEGMSEGVTEV